MNKLIFLSLIFCLVSCLPKKKTNLKFSEKNSTATNTGNNSNPDGTLAAPIDSSFEKPNEARALAILQNNCASCHDASSQGYGNFNNLDVTDMINSGQIVPGDPESSRIYSRISDGTMPTSYQLSSEDVSSVYLWIKDDLMVSSDPDSEETVVIPPPVLEATYSSINKNIFARKCLDCHNDTKKSGGFSLQTYSDLMKKVEPFKPNDSDVYTEALDGEMPIGAYALLTAEELTAIEEWILDGALDN